MHLYIGIHACVCVRVHVCMYAHLHTHARGECVWTLAWASQVHLWRAPAPTYRHVHLVRGLHANICMHSMPAGMICIHAWHAFMHSRCNIHAIVCNIHVEKQLSEYAGIHTMYRSERRFCGLGLILKSFACWLVILATQCFIRKRRDMILYIE